MFSKTTLLGYVAKAPEIKPALNGDLVATLRVLTSESEFHKQNGEWVKRTDGHNVVAFGRHAKYIQAAARKGSLIFLEGVPVSRSYEKDGQTHYYNEIKVVPGNGTVRIVNCPKPSDDDDAPVLEDDRSFHE